MQNDEIMKPIAIIHDRGFSRGNSQLVHMKLDICKKIILPENLNCDGKNVGYIMKRSRRRCKECNLSWSPTSEDTLRLFFSSPNCCALINKPRSLLPPGCYQTLTSDEQCHCYMDISQQ
ncbi:hypothetical protein PV327_010919 [Microctonus hyperodae]|uniref:Uncharacterized protein n=1 Tax=Microctonus hyperodae TaxID=165561 RepID=A0AA39F1F9_MICHY|nr:hypothetical protein PV327_010919 [Microctonus hyperodae]